MQETQLLQKLTSKKPSKMKNYLKIMVLLQTNRGEEAVNISRQHGEVKEGSLTVEEQAMVVAGAKHVHSRAQEQHQRKSDKPTRHPKSNRNHEHLVNKGSRHSHRRSSLSNNSP